MRKTGAVRDAIQPHQWWMRVASNECSMATTRPIERATWEAAGEASAMEIRLSVHHVVRTAGLLGGGPTYGLPLAVERGPTWE